MRWNPNSKWVISKDVAHEPLVSDDTFEEAQRQLARRARSATPHKPHRSRHPYVFKSLIHCALCQRKMQGQHAHGVAYYRCRYPQEYAIATTIDHPKNVYMREEALVEPLDQWLAHAFEPRTPRTHRQPTCRTEQSRRRPGR